MRQEQNFDIERFIVDMHYYFRPTDRKTNFILPLNFSPTFYPKTCSKDLIKSKNIFVEILTELHAVLSVYMTHLFS